MVNRGMSPRIARPVPPRHLRPVDRPAPVYGHRLAAPRPTLWLPLLLAVALSLPVLLATILSGLLF
jgi:hypothetical protein